MTKTDGVNFAYAGTNTTYSIVISNAGPSTADVVLTDTVTGPTSPAAASGSWTATNGHSGAGTVGFLDIISSLAPGATVTYTYTLVGIAGPAENLLTNVVFADPGATDPNPSNDFATDVDVILSPPR